MPTTDQIEQAWKTAAERIAGIVPHKITGNYCTPHDLNKLREDLEVFCRRVVDPVVAAYGEYAKYHSGQNIDQSLFTDQLLGALEGNALYELESAAERIAEEEADDDRSIRFEMERA